MEPNETDRAELARGVYMAGSRVFISYAFVNEQHPDYLFVQRLADDLRQEGADIIIDAADVDEQAFVHRLN